MDKKILRRAACDRRQVGTDIDAFALGLVAGGADLTKTSRPCSRFPTRVERRPVGRDDLAAIARGRGLRGEDS